MLEIKDNIREIQDRVEEVLKRTGRDLSEIRLLAVSKGHSLNKVNNVVNEGIKEFGESKVQEFLQKYDEASSELNWHFIGHLQRNKVKYLVKRPRCILIHSVDSLKLAEEIDKRAKAEGVVVNILIQVNTALDNSKYGIYPEELILLITKASRLKNINIKGLMTIAPYCDNSEEVRSYFRKLRELAEEVGRRGIEGVEMKELSMGMTNDWEIAIEEGATILRIGSGIFGERAYI